MKLRIIKEYHQLNLESKVDFLSAIVMMLLTWALSCIIFDFAIFFRQPWIISMSVILFFAGFVIALMMIRKQTPVKKTKFQFKKMKLKKNDNPFGVIKYE